jgi:hydrogenase/urease accessory protein HupE
MRLALAIVAVMLVVRAAPALAHPVPFSYLDVHLQPHEVEIVLVAHMFDLSHDLQIDPPERLLDPAFLGSQQDALVALLAPRFRLEADGTVLTPAGWSPAEALPDRQSVRLRVRYEVPGSPGVFAVDARMFPYDPAHQTFVNVYEGDALTLQAILDVAKTRLEYYAGSRQGALAVGRRFMPAGLRHVLLGPDHLTFLIGLVLLGGSLRRFAWIAGAFALGNLAALTLTMFNVMHPPARIIEPAVALSIVYIGADNLMVRGGRDMRAWIALAFGLIHGLWFANGLREMDLPVRAIGWSLFSFDIGVEIAQATIVFAVGFAVSAVRARHEGLGRRLAYAGSVAVIVGGVYWFVQRVFFPGGIV